MVFDSKKAEQEYERRTVDRRLYEKLSRYYPLPLGGKKEWARQPLLARGKREQNRINNIPLTQSLSIG